MQYSPKKANINETELSHLFRETAPLFRSGSFFKSGSRRSGVLLQNHSIHRFRIHGNNGLCDVSDSTSPLTTKPIYFTDKPDIKFTMDVCIVRNRNGKWERLKHEKTGIWQNDSYYWNVAPNSRNYVEKSKAIKDVPGWWEVVRQQYKDIKNRYLSKQDNDHPSFVCYIEAVNNVYNQMRQKGLL